MILNALVGNHEVAHIPMQVSNTNSLFIYLFNALVQDNTSVLGSSIHALLDSSLQKKATQGDTVSIARLHQLIVDSTSAKKTVVMYTN